MEDLDPSVEELRQAARFHKNKHVMFKKAHDWAMRDVEKLSEMMLALIWFDNNVIVPEDKDGRYAHLTYYKLKFDLHERAWEVIPADMKEKFGARSVFDLEDDLKMDAPHAHRFSPITAPCECGMTYEQWMTKEGSLPLDDLLDLNEERDFTFEEETHNGHTLFIVRVR